MIPQTIDFSNLLNDLEDIPSCPPIDPLQLPVTMLDRERDKRCSEGIYDLDHHMAEPCPECGGYRMSYGDWEYIGMCGVCYVKAEGSGY